MFWRKVCSSGGIEALGVDEAFLLRGVERRSGADVEALLDEIEYARGGCKVAARDVEPVLRSQYQKIRIGDADDRGQRDHLAIEAAGNRKLFGGALRGAVLAPEVDLVAGAERGAVGHPF